MDRPTTPGYYWYTSSDGTTVAHVYEWAGGLHARAAGSYGSWPVTESPGTWEALVDPAELAAAVRRIQELEAEKSQLIIDLERAASVAKAAGYMNTSLKDALDHNGQQYDAVRIQKDAAERRIHELEAQVSTLEDLKQRAGLAMVDALARTLVLERNAQQVAQKAREVDGWQETAAQMHQGMAFYRGLITQIGEMFGSAAKTSTDGSVQEDVLALKVRELDLIEQVERDRGLVIALKAEVDDLTQMLAAERRTVELAVGEMNHMQVDTLWDMVETRFIPRLRESLESSTRSSLGYGNINVMELFDQAVKKVCEEHPHGNHGG